MNDRLYKLGIKGLSGVVNLLFAVHSILQSAVVATQLNGKHSPFLTNDKTLTSHVFH